MKIRTDFVTNSSSSSFASAFTTTLVAGVITYAVFGMHCVSARLRGGGGDVDTDDSSVSDTTDSELDAVLEASAEAARQSAAEAANQDVGEVDQTPRDAAVAH